MRKKINLGSSDLISFKNSQNLKAQGTLLKLSQNHIVFEVYKPYSIVQLSEVLNDVKIVSNNDIIYSGKVVVTNLINTGLLLIVSATLVDSWCEKFKSSNELGIADQVDFIMTTLSKSTASIGGIIATSKEFASFLRMTSSPYVFQATIPPS